jgi:hypothetical protein
MSSGTRPTAESLEIADSGIAFLFEEQCAILTAPAGCLQSELIAGLQGREENGAIKNAILGAHSGKDPPRCLSGRDRTASECRQLAWARSPEGDR